MKIGDLVKWYELYGDISIVRDSGLGIVTSKIKIWRHEQNDTYIFKVYRFNKNDLFNFEKDNLEYLSEIG